MRHEHAPKSAALIINGKARSGERQLDLACDRLAKASVRLTTSETVCCPEALGAAVDRAISAGNAMIIIGGGDGSLLATVDRFADTDIVLGVLPLGTANSFARALGLPLGLEAAIGIIADGRPRQVDLGTVGDIPFAGCASMGLAPQIAQTVPHGLKAWAGRPGYLLWAAAQLAKFQAFSLTIANDGEEVTMDAVEVRIANGPYHGGVELVEAARLDSGKIVVQVVYGERRRHLLLNWFAQLAHSDARWRQVRQFGGRRSA
jgi:diacylglycerol kinase family enzyme